jgi:hypothetical protein
MIGASPGPRKRHDAPVWDRVASAGTIAFTMPKEERSGPRRRQPTPLRPIPTPATDSDLNELLAALSSEVKLLRRENKMLAGHNTRLTVVLAEQDAVTPPDHEPVEPLALREEMSLTELAEELRRRIDLLDLESEALRTQNRQLTELAKDLELPEWRIEETRVGSSHLVPGVRAFIRRRRVEPSRLRRRGPER